MSAKYEVVSSETDSSDQSLPLTAAEVPQRTTIFEFISDLLGFGVIVSLHRDAKILILCKTVRMFGFGFLSVMV